MGEVSPSDLMSLAQTTWKPQSLLIITTTPRTPGVSKRMGVVNHQEFLGSPPPQAVPLSPNPDSWENRCGSRGQELKRCSPSWDCPSQAPGAHHAVHTPSLPLLPPILTQRSKTPRGRGEEHQVETGAQAPIEALGISSKQEGTQWPHLILGSRRHGPDSDQGGTWR